MKKIGYKDDISTKWAESIRAVSSVEQLKKLCKSYGPLTKDALAVVENMKDDDLIEFKEGLLSEARGVYAGDEWAKKYIHVFMPDKMVDITCISAQTGAPEGMVYHRMKEEKLL